MERGVMRDAAVVIGEESRHKATTSAQMMPKNPCTGRWKPTSGEVGRGWKLHEEVCGRIGIDFFSSSNGYSYISFSY